jgi:hypothetical protein
VITAPDRPIFLLASGGRTGSSLLRKVLNSHPSVHLWFEHAAILNDLFAQHLAFVRWAKMARRWGEDMLPQDADVRRAAILYIRACFAEPAHRRGRQRWGFKEVHYDAEVARYLLDLFPDGRVIWLTRNPIDCFISMKRRELAPEGWSREATIRHLLSWEHINRSFLAMPSMPTEILPLRYEDLLSDRAGTLARIAEHVGLVPDVFDPEVFARHYAMERGTRFEDRLPIPRSSLTEEERALITTPGIVEACAAFGYELRFG